MKYFLFTLLFTLAHFANANPVFEKIDYNCGVFNKILQIGIQTVRSYESEDQKELEMDPFILMSTPEIKTVKNSLVASMAVANSTTYTIKDFPNISATLTIDFNNFKKSRPSCLVSYCER